MTSNLRWTPSRLLPDEWEAYANGIHYRITCFLTAGRTAGAHFANADKADLGRFEGGPMGKQAAMDACHAHAEAAGISLVSRLDCVMAIAIATGR
jgi:hypothetical protein